MYRHARESMENERAVQCLNVVREWRRCCGISDFRLQFLWSSHRPTSSEHRALGSYFLISVNGWGAFPSALAWCVCVSNLVSTRAPWWKKSLKKDNARPTWKSNSHRSVGVQISWRAWPENRAETEGCPLCVARKASAVHGVVSNLRIPRAGENLVSAQLNLVSLL